MATLQIRNVPEGVSRTLKARAAAEGRSLSDYLLQELSRVVARPTQHEVFERIEARGRLDLPPLAEMVRVERQDRP